MCSWALRLKTRFRFDDSLDVVAVHMVGGIVGTLLLGLLADHAINEAGAGGLDQLGRQAVAVLIALGWAFGCSLLIALGLDRAMGGIRVAPQHEFEGLDLHLHEEQAYIFDE